MMGKLSYDDKMLIQTLYVQDFGLKRYEQVILTNTGA